MTAQKTPSTVDWYKLRTALDGLSPEELTGLAAGTHVVVPRKLPDLLMIDLPPLNLTYRQRLNWTWEAILAALIEARNKP